MIESTDSTETQKTPVATEESITPPTEVDFEIRQQSDLVNLRVYNNSRTINTILMLSTDDADQLATELSEMAEEIEEELSEVID